MRYPHKRDTEFVAMPTNINKDPTSVGSESDLQSHYSPLQLGIFIWPTVVRLPPIVFQTLAGIIPKYFMALPFLKSLHNMQ